MFLPEFLTSADPKLANVITAFADSAREIAARIRTIDTGKAGTENQFGEEQLALDVLADQIIFHSLTQTGLVATAVSEEQPEVRNLGGTEFSVAFDPLDGSSLVDVNLAVGTIFGIWSGGEILGRTGKELAAAGYVVYGPRTTLVFSLGKNPCEFTLQADGTWLRTKNNLQIGEGKMFAPGNLRACADNSTYMKLVEYWMREGYTLRYSGGMVPDVNQILLKGKGVFSYPGSAAHPAKLRLTFECAPLAFVIESAGGASSDGAYSILKKKITALDERTAVCLGSKEEVRRFEEFII